MALRAAAARLASSSLRRRHSHLLPAALLSPAATTGPTVFLHSHATSFGYKQVREDEKSKLVGNVFSSVASSYDVMNDLMSVGLHRLWKDRLISKLNPFPGMKHLDVAGGTGDVAFRVVERIKSVSHRATQGTLTDFEEDTHIYVCDINPNMLDVGKKRAAEKGYNEEHCLSWVQGDAEALSFEDGSMDGYTIAFGIRNVTHIEKALSEAYRVLKKGGRFLCLELSHVDVPVFKDIYDVYSFSVIPAVGELVAGDRQSYQYLVESIRRFPKQEKFAQMIKCDGGAVKDFSKGVTEFNTARLYDEESMTVRLMSWLSSVELVCADVTHPLEASISMNILKGTCDLTRVAAWTTRNTDDRIILYDGVAAASSLTMSSGKSIALSRRVVLVPLDEKLVLHIVVDDDETEELVLTLGHSDDEHKHVRKTGCGEVEVKVDWLIVPKKRKRCNMWEDIGNQHLLL